MRLTDKAIIVTGSTTGIGEAIARRCLEEGARVLLHGRDIERGRKIAEEFPGKTAFHNDDLADPAAPQESSKPRINAFGRIDSLVNNAAWVVRSDLTSTDAVMFDRVMAINVRAPMLLIQAAYDHLKKSQGCDPQHRLDQRLLRREQPARL